VVWALSFGIWTLIGLAASVSVYVLWLSRGYPMTFASVLYSEFSQILVYAPLTPFVLALAMRFPIQKGNWVRRSLLHLLFAVAFSIAHVVLRGLSPYATWDAKTQRFVSIFWNSQLQIFEIKWLMFKNLILLNIVDDTTGAYVPIVLVAHALSYYQSLRDREVHSAKLEMQLAKSHLESLKSHLRPHFLFNTLNSIAALVHDDPAGAERMTGQLAALLRSALDSTAMPLVPLEEELRIVRAYLDIERVRFGDRLRYDVHLDAGASSAAVPRMALQTLVENSVKYAVSPRREGGSICVTATAADGRVRVTVEDDGPGFNGAHRPEGHGLALLDARLALLFGTRASMRVDSRAGHTGVIIEVPA